MSGGLTLTLDASTTIGTVAVIAGSRIVAEGETRMRGEAGERLLPTIELVLRQAGASVEDVGEVVCGNGPGSFTSLRIAAGVAKGLCHALDVPIFSVSSLLLIVAGQHPALDSGRYLATLDAMRGELFVMEIDARSDGSCVPGPMTRMTRDEAIRHAEGAKLRLIGSAGGGELPHARGVASLRERSTADSIFRVSLDTWEPDYGRLAEAQVKWEAAHERALG